MREVIFVLLKFNKVRQICQIGGEMMKKVFDGLENIITSLS